MGKIVKGVCKEILISIIFGIKKSDCFFIYYFF